MCPARGDSTQTTPVFVLRVVAKSPGFFKSSGICDYAAALATCIKLEVEAFIRYNPQQSGPVKSRMVKAVMGGQEISCPRSQRRASQQRR